jgi:hypothetical protein
MAKQKVRHPVTGMKEMRVRYVAESRSTVVHLMRQARYTAGEPYWVEELFATIRASVEGVFTARTGFVVTRGSFDDIRQFDTHEQAMTYVEALFALEE